MTPIIIKFRKLHPGAIIPKYQTPGAAGLDLHWDGQLGLSTDICTDYECHDAVWVDQMGYVFRTGLSVEIPEGFEGQIRPRSSLGKAGLHVYLGTIDSDYRGELAVRIQLLREGSSRAVRVSKGDRIAQLVIAPVARCQIVEAEELSDTARGAGAFGSTGR